MLKMFNYTRSSNENQNAIVDSALELARAYYDGKKPADYDEKNKADLEGIGKHLIHHVMEFTGMRTVAFVNQKENILIFDLGSGFCCRFKLIDRCGDQSAATLFQQRNQTASSSCFHWVHAGMDKIVP